VALVTLNTGLWFPTEPMFYAFGAIDGSAMTAATNKKAFIGHVYIDGRPGSAKTISSAGGKIYYRTGTTTFANGSTTVDIGIQDVDLVNGPPPFPDGTFDVKTTLTGGGGGISSAAFNTATMSAGSKSVSHGDLIAVVFDMTARGGADSVIIRGAGRPDSSSINAVLRPKFVGFTGSWFGTVLSHPYCFIEFDDGTLGVLAGSPLVAAATTEAFQDSTNPDERALLFQVPFQCKVDALALRMASADANSDSTLTLYETPLGTPNSLASVSLTGQNLVAGTGAVIVPLASEVTLAADTDYALALKGAGTSNVTLSAMTLDATGFRAFLPGGTTLRKGTRNNSSGAFSEESPAVTVYQMAVRISQFHASGGSPGGAHILGGSVVR
jgi:hypothetical protein